jgi:hypothetical protein
MLKRILLSTVAAMTLAAVPALADDSGKVADARALPKCCDHLSMHMYGVAPQDATESKKIPARDQDRTIQDPNSDDPDVRNQSWGG